MDLRDTVHVIKAGGAVFESEESRAAFLDRFAAMPGRKILVHGGGAAATELSRRLGIPVNIIDGRRVTDRETLDVAVMVYAGLINRRIVAQLQARGVCAVGLTGADADFLLARRRTGEPDMGWVGDILNVKVSVLTGFFAEGWTPVVAPVTHDGTGELLNTNADSIASAIAKALSKRFSVSLQFCTDTPGVLADRDDAASVLRTLSATEYALLARSGAVTAGMRPKLDAGFGALAGGVETVRISSVEALGHFANGSDDGARQAGTTLING